MRNQYYNSMYHSAVVADTDRHSSERAKQKGLHPARPLWAMWKWCLIVTVSVTLVAGFGAKFFH